MNTSQLRKLVQLAQYLTGYNLTRYSKKHLVLQFTSQTKQIQYKWLNNEWTWVTSTNI